MCSVSFQFVFLDGLLTVILANDLDNADYGKSAVWARIIWIIIYIACRKCFLQNKLVGSLKLTVIQGTKLGTFV
jgi:hypothetical protein